MKKIFFTMVISLTLSINYSFAQCGCGISISGISCTSQVWPGAGGCKIDTGFNYGDNINLVVGETNECEYFFIDEITWYRNTVAIDTWSSTYTITDTGTYVEVVWSDDGAPCNYFMCSDTVYVYYRPAAPVLEVINPNAFQIYPTVSTGMFYIKESDQNKLKKIQITDCAGRIVFRSADNLSQIDLADFSNGIYLYAIEDSKEQIFRGKIMKE